MKVALAFSLERAHDAEKRGEGGVKDVTRPADYVRPKTAGPPRFL